MRKTLSLIIAIVLALGCMSINAFAEETDNTTDITLTVAKSLTYDMVIPQDVTNINAAGVFEVGQAKVANVKNATVKTVISYTAETTAFKSEGKTDIPANYYTDSEGKTAFPTSAIEVYKNEADATSIPTMYVGISENDYNAAENGTYTATVTFNFDAKTRIDFKNVDGKSYFPVFSECPVGVHFYSSDGTEYNSMNPAISYAMVPVGTTVHAIRSKITAWDNVFYIEDEGASTAYPCKASGINTSFVTGELVDGNENTEHVLRIDGDPTSREATPTYNGVSLTDISNVYAGNGFLSKTSPNILSETAQSSNYSFRFNGVSNTWSAGSRNATGSFVCIVRDFTA